MKTIIIFISLFLTLNSNAQNKGIKTDTLAVKGNCDQCKERIENAADIKGVKLAVWNETTQLLIVTYKTDKVTIEQIEKAIVAKGHDVGTLKSSESTYKKLPECCQYRDKKCELPKK